MSEIDKNVHSEWIVAFTRKKEGGARFVCFFTKRGNLKFESDKSLGREVHFSHVPWDNIIF